MVAAAARVRGGGSTGSTRLRRKSRYLYRSERAEYGAREIFLRARPFTGSASSHARPITRETVDIIRVPEQYEFC
jgi:hypothetical protein